MPNAPLASRLGPALRRRVTVAPPRALAARRRMASDEHLSEAERALARRVSWRISPRDAMHGNDLDAYYEVGLSALRCVDAGLAAAGAPPPRTILDLPSGHGRVLRWLAVHFPHAGLTACDLDRDGVDYCARAFRAEPADSAVDLAALALPRRFDLAFCGSLATHLDAEPIRALLGFFSRHLEPGGVLVTTTHGAESVRRLETGDSDYGLGPERSASLLAALRAEGFGYVDYPGASGYGISLTPPEWVRGQLRDAGLREVRFAERGWDDHQDVFALVAG